jgi:uncharacterized membrane protein HdeD (DUF308 family)
LTLRLLVAFCGAFALVDGAFAIVGAVRAIERRRGVGLLLPSASWPSSSSAIIFWLPKR